MDVIVIDFESFKCDTVLCWLNLTKKTEGHFVNDLDGIKQFYRENINNLFVGYNIKGYDAYIYKAIIMGLNPHEVSDWIVKEGKQGWQFNSEMNRIPLNIYDVYTGKIDKDLKTLEAFMGVSIHESSVSFDLDRPLTDEELEETVKYCTDDVRNTARVFKYRIGDFISYTMLIKNFKLPMSAFSKTKAQISSMILKARKVMPPFQDDYDYILPQCLQLGKYGFMLDWFYKPENKTPHCKNVLQFETDNAKVCAGFGGMHDENGFMDVSGYLLNVDVASYYPHLIKHYGLMSRAVPDPNVYYQMIDNRIALKKTNPALASALKICLNSVYGTLRTYESDMTDFRMGNSVAISGQLLLIDLLEKIESRCQIINVNTDGLLVKCDSPEDIEWVKERAREWEQRSKMTLEYDEYSHYVGKDVNNYILMDSAREHVKYKGAMVKDLSPLDYNTAVVNQAIRRYIMDGVKPEETVYGNNNLMDYMIVCKLKGDFKQIVHKENGELVKVPNKVVRVFASKDSNDGYIGRTREQKSSQMTLGFDENGEWNKESSIQGLNKFADTPENCFIENGDIRGLSCPEKLDKQWYVDQVYSKLEFWKA